MLGIQRGASVKYDKIFLFTLVFLVSASLSISIPVAFADNVQDSIADGTIITKFPGQSFKTDYFVTASSNQGTSDPPGCNIGTVPNEVATVNLTIVATSGSLTTLSYTPYPIKLSSCNTKFPVTFTSTASGTYQISAATVDEDGNAYSTNGSFVLVFVDNTPPVITVAINPASPDGANGWYVSPVAIDWTVTDPESPITSPPCQDQTITTDFGETTFTCTATSAGGTSSL